jgi:hypothetical protein
MRSPTERTLKALREGGAIARVVERWNPYARKRQDLFGQDIQAIQGCKLIGVQSTSGAHHADHVTKAITNPEVAAWLRTGNGFEIWSWAKKGPRGKRKLWQSRVTQLRLDGSQDKVVEA